MSDPELIRLCRDALRDEHTDVDDMVLTGDTELLSLVDSVTLMDVIARVEGQLGVVLPDDVLTQLCTIADLERAVASLQEEQLAQPGNESGQGCRVDR